MSMSKDSKQKVWLEHYRRFLNVEFDWDPDYLSDEPPVEGPLIPITNDTVVRKLSLRWRWAKHWTHQAQWWRWYKQPMTRAPLRSVTLQLQSIAMARDSLTWSRISLSAYTKVRGMHGKRVNWCSLKLTKQVMKVLERIVDCVIRQLVSIDDSQFGFDPGRGTTDAWKWGN